MKSRTLKHKPSTWERIAGITVIDPDGWSGEKSFNAPITRKEWAQRMRRSTCRHHGLSVKVKVINA